MEKWWCLFGIMGSQNVVIHIFYTKNLCMTLDKIYSNQWYDVTDQGKGENYSLAS